MDAKLLVDNIVRQTMVFIAELSTAAGVRAPLAHIADQVFLSLAQEIERQGVGRKVAADMFGMALRSYQIKVQRLAESATVRNHTLWEAVLDFIDREGCAGDPDASAPREVSVLFGCRMRNADGLCVSLPP